MIHPFFHQAARRMPQLKHKLSQADQDVEPAAFVRRCMISAFYMSMGVGFTLFMLFLKFQKPLIIAVLAIPSFFLLTYWYLLKLPDLIIAKKRKEIDKEIVFAGKFLIVELKAGVPLYQVLKNISSNYGVMGHYFKGIVDEIDIGTEVQTAITNAILKNPSHNFRKVMWQLSNSLRTGADVSQSLDGVLDQISRQQLIEVEKYGKKLNPIAMFYLMLAVIIPSLGMVMGVILASFIDVRLPLPLLLFIAFALAGFQFLFYAMITSNRPAVDI